MLRRMVPPPAKGAQKTEATTRVKSTRPLLPREFVARAKQRRITDAIAELSAEKGYEATSIADIVRRAGVARKTLYDNFDGKEEVFLTALDGTFEEALSRVEGAASAAGGDWRRQLEAALGALLTCVAERPAFARVALVESLSATPASAARHDAALVSFVDCLRRIVPAETDLPATIAESLVGGVAWILNQRIRHGEAEQALDLLPELTEFVLSPYHGV